jgi:hypothetical protein
MLADRGALEIAARARAIDDGVERKDSSFRKVTESAV